MSNKMSFIFLESYLCVLGDPRIEKETGIWIAHGCVPNFGLCLSIQRAAFSLFFPRDLLLPGLSSLLLEELPQGFQFLLPVP